MIIFSSILSLLLSIWVFIHLKMRPAPRFAIIIMLAVYLLALGVYGVSDYFTGNGLDESVIYHLKVGLTGTSFIDYSQLIFFTVLYILFSCGVIYGVYKILRIRSKRDTGVTNIDSEPSVSIKKTRWMFVCGGVFFVLAFYLNPLLHNIYDLYGTKTYNFSSDIDDADFIIPQVEQLKAKKNIVFIYLESLERTYLDETLFPGLAPNLRDIEASNLSFTGLNQVYYTGFTIGGIIGSQCGVPMYAPKNTNEMGRFDKFLPNAVCMGDILKTIGYDLHFLGGASLNFAGKGKFYKTHGFSHVMGRAAFKEIYEERSDYSGWGLHDDRLLSHGFDTYTKLSKKREPFGLFLLTLDTHHPNGLTSETCSSPEFKYNDGETGILNSVHCTDKLVPDFVKKILDSPGAENTLIVLASDHFAMKNTVLDTLEQGDRRNYFVIIDPEKPNARKVTRAGSILDVGSTVMSYMGLDVDGIGFGRNLLGELPTLLEKAPDQYDDYLKVKEKELIAKLWAFPDLNKGFRVDAIHQRLLIDNAPLEDRWMDLPVVISFDKQKNIEALKFDHPHSRKFRDYMAKYTPREDSFLWVDYCDVIARKSAEEEVPVPEEDRYCYAYRPSKGEDVMVTQVIHDKKLSFSDLNNKTKLD